MHQVSTKLSCKILLWARNAFAQVKVGSLVNMAVCAHSNKAAPGAFKAHLRRLALGKTVHNKIGKCIKKYIVLGKGESVLSCMESLNMLVLSVKRRQ